MKKTIIMGKQQKQRSRGFLEKQPGGQCGRRRGAWAEARAEGRAGHPGHTRV